MEATQDFDERKKIRARMKVVREAKSGECLVLIGYCYLDIFVDFQCETPL